MTSQVVGITSIETRTQSLCAIIVYIIMNIGEQWTAIGMLP